MDNQIVVFLLCLLAATVTTVQAQTSSPTPSQTAPTAAPTASAEPSISKAAGLAFAVVSALFNGSFSSLMKIKRVEAVSPVWYLFTLYASIGVFLSSWLVIPLLSSSALPDSIVGSRFFSFTNYGFLAGGLFITCLSCSFSAIPLVGVSLGSGVWCGTAILTSFVWGIVAFPGNNIIKSTGYTVLALCVLIFGVTAMACCDPIANKLLKNKCSGLDYIAQEDTDTLESVNSVDDMERQGNATTTKAALVTGICLSVMVGLFGGSILVPLNLDTEHSGLVFIPSFGVGTLLFGCLSFCAVSAKNRQFPLMHMREALLPGLISGVLWNLGNILSVVGINTLGYSVAYPILQCALLFAGLWGIFVFKEIQGRAVWVFFFGALIALGGAALLASHVGPP